MYHFLVEFFLKVLLVKVKNDFEKTNCSFILELEWIIPFPHPHPFFVIGSGVEWG
jgi:hypothetical protein